MAEPDTNASAMPVLQAGEKLRRARERAGIDLAELAQWTRIKQAHLDALEQGDYDRLPGRTYTIGFARTYAQAVGANADEIVRALREELDRRDRTAPARPAHHLQLDDPAKVPSSRLAWAAGLLALIILVGLGVFWRSYFAPAAELPPVTMEESPALAAPELNPRSEIGPTAESALLAPIPAPSQTSPTPGQPTLRPQAGTGAQVAPAQPAGQLSPARP